MIEDVFGPGDPPSQEQLGHAAWARHLARLLDTQISLWIAAFVIGAAAGLLARAGSFGLSNLLVYRPGWGAVVGLSSGYLISGLLEAFCLNAFGATPGKALMGVRVREPDGHKLSFVRAFKRWFSALLTGCGFGFPVLSFILNYVAYRRFLREGVTVWDDEMDVWVERRPVAEWRWLSLIALVLSVFAFSAKAAHFLFMILRLVVDAPMLHRL